MVNNGNGKRPPQTSVGRVDDGVMTYLGDVIETAVDGVGRVNEREDVVKDGGGRLLTEHVQH